MKKYLLLSISILLAGLSNAQVWQGAGSTSNNTTGVIYRSGNVGIGTFAADPTSNLHLKGANIVLKIEGESVPNPQGPVADNYSTVNVVGNNPTINLTGVGNVAGAYYPKISFQNLFELKYSVYPACGSGGFKIGNVSGNAIYINPDGTMNFGTGSNLNCYNSGRVQANYTFNNSVGVAQLLVSPANNFSFGIASGFLVGVNGKSHFNDYVSIGSATDVSANGYKFNVTGNSSFNGNVGIGTTAAPTTKLEVVGDVKVNGSVTAKVATFSAVPQGDGSCGWVGVGRSDAVGGAFWTMRHYDNTNNTSDPNRSSTQNQLQFVTYTNGTWNPSPLALTTKGQVLVNTTLPPQSDNTKLSVNGDALVNGSITATVGLGGIAANIFNTARAGDNGCGYLNIGNKTNNNYYTFLYQANPSGGEILTLNAALNGQWNNNMTLFPTGQVSIGTSTFPTNASNAKLAVAGNMYASNDIISNGVIASYKTPDAGNFAGQINLGALDPTPNNPNASAWLMANVATLNKTTDKIVFARWSPANWVTAMSINKTGQVVVGSEDAPAAASCAKLYVDGYIASKEVRVSLTNWCDYVFDDTYKLKPLEEVEAFIKTNKHLPEIPSEKEVVENGVGLGDMSKMHMKKIEELTLYMIELKKQNDKLSEEVSELKKLINK